MRSRNAAAEVLREIRPVRQRRGEPKRRWFSSPRCDLIVWLGEASEPVGFQFCYDKGADEHALSWSAPQGFSHMAVDSGEVHPMRFKGSPVLVPNGQYDAARVRHLFHAESGALPKPLVRFVMEKLEALPAA